MRRTSFCTATIGPSTWLAREDLRLREGDVAKGAPINPKIGRIIFEEATQAVVKRLRRERQAQP